MAHALVMENLNELERLAVEALIHGESITEESVAPTVVPDEEWGMSPEAERAAWRLLDEEGMTTA